MLGGRDCCRSLTPSPLGRLVHFREPACPPPCRVRGTGRRAGAGGRLGGRAAGVGAAPLWAALISRRPGCGSACKNGREELGVGWLSRRLKTLC